MVAPISRAAIKREVGAMLLQKKSVEISTSISVNAASTSVKVRPTYTFLIKSDLTSALSGWKHPEHGEN